MFSVLQNPLRLVSDIVKGEYEDIDPQYTNEMNSLVNILLSQVLKIFQLLIEAVIATVIDTDLKQVSLQPNSM